MSASTLGSRVKAWRKELGLSQRDLPGIDSGALSRIESGKAKDVGSETLQKLGKALGRTLEELAGAPASGVRSIELRDIEADPDNPRTLDVGDAVDANFVESIRTQGLLQAVTVRPSPDTPGKWRIAFGGRRYAALVAIHGPKSKVAIAATLATAEGSQLLLQQLAENVQRADMNPWDLARSICALVDGAMDTQAIAEALGRKRRWVQEMASVGRNLHQGACNALMTGRISISQAVAIAAEKDEAAQNELVNKSCDDKLNEDEIRAITADRKAAIEEKKKAAAGQIDIEDVAGGPKTEEKPRPATPWLVWKGQRGSVKIRLHVFGTGSQFVQEGACDWRPPGGSIWHWSADLVNFGTKKQALRTYHTKWQAFAAALRWGWGDLMRRSTDADEKALRKFLQWGAEHLRTFGNDGEKAEAILKGMEDELDARLNPPEPTAPERREEAYPEAPPPEEPPSIDLATVPEWATPMVDSLFVVVSDGPALLCHGWLHMTKTAARLVPDKYLADLFARDEWGDDDEDATPTDFICGHCSIHRVVEAPQ